MRKDGFVNVYVEVIGHGEVRDALAPGWMLLGKLDLALATKLGTPQAYAPLHSAQHAGVPLGGIAALELFEQGDGIAATGTQARA